MKFKVDDIIRSKHDHSRRYLVYAIGDEITLENIDGGSRLGMTSSQQDDYELIDRVPEQYSTEQLINAVTAWCLDFPAANGDSRVKRDQIIERLRRSDNG